MPQRAPSARATNPTRAPPGSSATADWLLPPGLGAGCHVRAALERQSERAATLARVLLLGTMPYVLISTQIRMEVGPTMVGDEHSDPNLMLYLGATKRNMLGNHFWEYYVEDAPRIVLDKLEKRGYRVISMTGVGQTLVWCLHKENAKNSDFLPNQDIAVNRPA